MIRLIPLALLPLVLAGCVSFGVECRTGSTNAWVKVRRFGWGVPPKQAQTLADVKTKVCP